MKISDAVTGFWLTNRLNMSKATQAKYDHVYRRLVEVLGDKLQGICAQHWQMIYANRLLDSD